VHFNASLYAKEITPFTVHPQWMHLTVEDFFVCARLLKPVSLLAGTVTFMHSSERPKSYMRKNSNAYYTKLTFLKLSGHDAVHQQTCFQQIPDVIST
jgi:hypothetical protein